MEAEHSAQVTSITVDSTISKPAIIIDREYFYTKRQRNNNKRKDEIGPEWQVLRKKVLTIINSQLDLTFIVNTQNQGLKILSNNTRCDVISMHDIGTCYTQETSTENVTKLNYVMYVHFTDNPTYLYNIEKMIMTKLKIEYDNENEKDMGCIARLVTNTENDKVILIYYVISIVYRHLLSNISIFIEIKTLHSEEIELIS